MNKERVIKELKRKYPADQFGVWRVQGEDPNCDLGGAHIKPELATVQGFYGEVVDYAVMLPGFFQWGSGGIIRPADVVYLSYRTEQEAIWAKLNKPA